MNENVLKTIIIYAIAEFAAVGFMYLAQQKVRSDHDIILKGKRVVIKKSLLFLILSLLPLLLLNTLKSDRVGMDTSVYMEAYNNMRNDALTEQQSSWLGSGFKIIMLGFTTLGLDYHVFFACISLITLILFYGTIWKQSKNPALSIFIFISTCLFFQMFNQYRQMLAISIVFFSIQYIVTARSFPKFLVCMLIASSIHTSAVIFLPMFFISKIKVNKKTLLLYLAIGLTLFIAYPIVVNLLSQTYYGQTYFNSYLDISFKPSTIINTGVRCILLAFVLITLIRGKRKIDTSYQTLIHTAIICTVIQFLTMQSFLFGRVTTYFFIFYLVLIPDILIDYYQKKSILYLIIAFFISYQFVYYNSQNAIESGYKEYYFSFETPKPLNEGETQ